MKKINLGLDLHGTLDDNPKFFMNLILQLKYSGYNVVIHVLSGKCYSQLIEEKLMCLHNEHIKWWDRYFSVETYLLNLGKHYIMDEIVNRPIFENNVWNEAKALYCQRSNIDLHIDNEHKYLYYFRTPCLYYPLYFMTEEEYMKIIFNILNKKELL